MKIFYHFNKSIASPIVHLFGSFWRSHPALLYALSVLIGLHAALHWSVLLLIPLIALEGPLLLAWFSTSERLRSRLLISLMLLVSVFFYVQSAYRYPNLPDEGVSGIAHIKISSVNSVRTAFNQAWIYKGTLHSFLPEEGDESIAKDIPFSVRVAIKDMIMRPPANSDYLVDATLKLSETGQYILIINSQEAWHPISNTWSLAEYRYQIKTSFKNYLKEHLKGQRVGNFLAGIATGDFDDRLIQFEFGRFGLQHIMAVSGFHFGIIAAILSMVLRFWLSRKQTALLMIFALTLYFVFLGCNASIMRAWVTILVVFLGNLLNKKSTALNTLGVALLVIFFTDPLLCQTVGFELSFLSTAAILFFFNGCDTLMQTLWLKRPLSKVVDMDYGSQHAILLLNFSRQALALTLAVHIVALPMMLFYFHKFPWMSLLYNLFFPFMVSMSMLLLLVGVFFGLVCPPLASAFHTLNSYYTNFMLNLTFNMPPAVDITWHSEGITEVFILAYLCCIFWIGVMLKNYLKKRKEELQDLAFL